MFEQNFNRIFSLSPYHKNMASSTSADLKDPNDFKDVRIVEAILFSALRIRRHRPFVILVGEDVGIRDFRVMPTGHFDSVRIFVAQIVFKRQQIVFDMGVRRKFTMYNFYAIIENYDTAISYKTLRMSWNSSPFIARITFIGIYRAVQYVFIAIAFY